MKPMEERKNKRIGFHYELLLVNQVYFFKSYTTYKLEVLEIYFVGCP